MKKRKSEPDFVWPKPEIVNRRTGYVEKFGPRRAFDGAYVLEVLRASGCWTEDYEKALWVLQPLVENDCGDFSVQQLVNLLPYGSEQLTPEEREQLPRHGTGAFATKVNGVFTIKHGKPRLTIVPKEGEQ